MSTSRTILVPDIGEFDAVDVVEVLITAGDRVEVDQALVVLESDKASMEVPSPAAGLVLQVSVAEGDQIGEGAELCTLSVEEGASVAEAPPAATSQPRTAAAPPAGDARHCQLLVLGGGPGGYTAAFRAADLGLEVVLVERYPTLGGVCLNVGCIPSKALLHMASVLEEARALGAHGIGWSEPSFDWERIRARKNEVVGTLTSGLAGLARARKVEVITGSGHFTGSHEVEISGAEGARSISFDQAIVATGSRPVSLPGWPDDPRIMDSTAALEIDGPPGRLLVVGGGIIGLEMATVYLAFGWQVTIVELLSELMAGADRDLVRPLEKRLRAACEGIHLATAVAAVEPNGDGLVAHFEGETAPDSTTFDRVLVAVGRRPNSADIGLEELGVQIDERGFVPVDIQTRTNTPHVFAIGDLTGAPLLAHRATHQGRVAAEVAAGLKSTFDPATIPSVAYTDPEVAWSGITELEAKAQGVGVTKAVFPWAASGRAIGIGRTEGLTKLLFAEDDGRLLGAGIVGTHAGELIAEPTLGIELGADAEDMGLTIHAHPTLSETIAFAAEVAAGTATDLPPRRR